MASEAPQVSAALRKKVLRVLFISLLLDLVRHLARCTTRVLTQLS
jgi:hypothetical protein